MKWEEILGMLILQGLRQSLAYQQTLQRAHEEGRPVSDADIDNLGELGENIRRAARDEANRQRAESAPTPTE